MFCWMVLTKAQTHQAIVAEASSSSTMVESCKEVLVNNPLVLNVAQLHAKVEAIMNMQKSISDAIQEYQQSTSAIHLQTTSKCLEFIRFQACFFEGRS